MLNDKVIEVGVAASNAAGDLRSVTIVIDALVDACKTEDEQARLAAIQVIRNSRQHYLTEKQTQLTDQLTQLAMATGTRELAGYSDELNALTDGWDLIGQDTIGNCLQDPVDPARMTQLAADCRKLQTQLFLFAVPLTLPDVLRQRRGATGIYDAEAEWVSFLPDANDRTMLLTSLSQLSPRTLGGLVDVEAGKIYRLGGTSDKAVVYGGIALFLAIGLAGCWLATEGNVPIPAILPEEGFKDVTFRDAAVSYGIFVAGYLAHVIKKAYEVRRTVNSSADGLWTIDHTYQWIAVKWLDFLKSAAAAVGVFFVVYGAGQHDPLAMISTGFAVDSVAELAMPRFSEALVGRVATVRKALEGAPAPVPGTAGS